MTITHPMVKLTNFRIHGMYMNIHGVSGAYAIIQENVP